MSSGDEPPPMFDGEDFSYWKIRMEAYLEAVDYDVYLASINGYPKPVDPQEPTSSETNQEKCNAKARNILFRAIGKDVFNRVRTHKNAHELWDALVMMHVGSNGEREERHSLLMKKLNALQMLPIELANDLF